MTIGSDRLLEGRVLEAHEAGDCDALWRLYRVAASDADRAGDTDHAAFLLTHAWVFALDVGADDAASQLFEELRERGRA